MNIELSIAATFPSRYPLDKEILFHPAIDNLSVDEANMIALRAKIVGVHFDEMKVTYDLALLTPTYDGPPAYYDALPARCIDSLFVKSLEDIAASDPTRPPAAGFLSEAELTPLVDDYTALSSAVEALTSALSDDLATASANRATTAFAAFAAALDARPLQSND